ncbi:STAS domain-containing protein [Dactylosporangium sp. CS-047395]
MASLDSTALSVFVGIHKRLRGLGTSLVLVSPHEQLHESSG